MHEHLLRGNGGGDIVGPLPTAISSRSAATAALAVAIACQPEPVDDLLFVPAVVAETSAPLSHNNAIALTDEATACVIDSFEMRIHCVDRNGRLVGKFGAEGEGPGEFRRLVGLRRGAEGRVARISHTGKPEASEGRVEAVTSVVNGVGAKKQALGGCFRSGREGDRLAEGAFTGFGTQWSCERRVEKVGSGRCLPW